MRVRWKYSVTLAFVYSPVTESRSSTDSSAAYVSVALASFARMVPDAVEGGPYMRRSSETLT